MANVHIAMNQIKKVEHSGVDGRILHYNPGEAGYTYFGIYSVAHPTWIGWDRVHAELKRQPNVYKASETLAKDPVLQNMVDSFYKTLFWNKMRLDDIVSQHKAEEMFVFGVNAGCKAAVRAAQNVSGATPDGLIGPKTITAINACDEDRFDKEYDVEEKKYYEMLVARNPKFKINIRGWYNRADAV